MSIGCGGGAGQPEAVPAKVTLTVADRAAFDALLARHGGEVVLVDFWATWCAPCVANFPHVVALADRDRSRGLAVVTVSLDSPEAAEKVLHFLREQDAAATINLLSQYGGGTQAIREFEIPHGAIPCYRLYDRNGQLRQTFGVNPLAERQFTLQDLDATIEQLLAE